MRPVRLEMKGFSTFRDETVIDFADIELLALIGPTGSGKSSVIDAMTFALYGSAARYDERAVAPVINQLSPEARVRFTFEVAGEVYSATRVVRRTKAGATTKEARLERGEALLAGDPKALSEAITRLLGLDFQRFNKTVVLPQGRFAEFLHDKPSDRQELLRELFGYGVYEQLGRRARELANTTRNEATVREQGLAELGDISADRLADAQAAVVAVSHARAQLNEVGTKLIDAGRELGALDQQIETATARLELLADVETPDNVADLSALVVAAADAERAAAAAREAARADLMTARDAATNGPDQLACRQLLDAYERHRAFEVRAADAVTKVEAAELELASSSAAADRAQLEIDAAKKLAAEARQHRDAIADALTSAGDRFQLTAAIAKYERLEMSASELAKQVLAHREAETRAAQATTRMNDATAEVERLERLAPAAALAAHLHVGEACPVCEQTVQQLPDVAAVDDAELTAARAVAQDLRRACVEADRVTHEAAAQLSVLDKERSSLLADLRELPDRQAIAAQLQTLKELAATAESARQEAMIAEAAASDAEADPTRKAVIVAHRAEESNLLTQQALAAQARADLESNSKHLDGQPSEETLRTDVELARTLAAAVAEAQQEEETAEDQHTRRLQERETAEAAERRARHEFESTCERLVELKPPKASGSLAADWDALVSWCSEQSSLLSADVTGVHERRDTLAADRRAVAHLIEELVEGFADDPAAPLDDLRAELISAEADAKHVVKQLEKAIAQHAKVVAHVETLRADAGVADLLGKLLKADRFQRWLLEEAMNDLVERATVRLRELTADQYSLVADDGAFKIVDHRNADEVRDARSLSGGETFLTSLSLALALADSTMDLAAEGAAPMESIFLDEGFGTLDPDTLEVVASTIEELGASGRMVGIVTHIRDLADRMPTRLEITKGPNGSTVERMDV